ncbi:MAG: 2Fe-2S iron-sulfur cluster binding domain-containing protein [Bryobacterales bacterium]|nr:2Fe-2S iron-sulfur cluster binding domain-containing protein [Bryobacterales bacterium]
MSELEVTLVTRDGAELRFPCAQAENVLGASEAAGYYLPAMCHEGTCGLCHARVTEGKYTMGPHNSAALRADVPGEVLLCRCSPDEDLTVALPYNQAQILRYKVPVRQAVIETMAPAWQDAVALTLRLQPDAATGTAVEFSPGQYMELTIPGTEIRRAYSLANLPNWEGRLDFLIRLAPNGMFSTWLREQARVGDAITVRGPSGSFILDETSVRPRCFVGGGCGLAPILSMLRHLGEFQDSQPTHLIFGANRQAELVPAAEVEAVSAALPQLGVTLAVTSPEEGWQGFQGTAPAALEVYLSQADEPMDIYACGPPKMLEAVEKLVEKRGRGDRVIAERL